MFSTSYTFFNAYSVDAIRLRVFRKHACKQSAQVFCSSVPSDSKKYSFQGDESNAACFNCFIVIGKKK